jgi:hypothetical protein
MDRQLQASASIRAPLAIAADLLRADPGAVFSDGPATDDQRRARRFTVPVGAPVGSGAAVEQLVDLEVGAVDVEGGTATVPVRWEPAGHQRLLPTFVGELVLRADGAGRTDVELHGSYRVPLGPVVGRFGDTLIGRRIARQSLGDLLGAAARRLDEVVDRRHDDRPRSTPYHPDLRDHHHDTGRSEHFIG